MSTSETLKEAAAAATKASEASVSARALPPKKTVSSVVVVGGTHGNEYTGVWCIKALESPGTKDMVKGAYPSLEISTLLGNPLAHAQNKRFVDEDLNRQFSLDALHGDDKIDDSGLLRVAETVEAKRAEEINELLGPKFDHFHENAEELRTDIVVDLHSTTSNMGITLIVAEGDVLMTQAAAYVAKKCNQVRIMAEGDASDDLDTIYDVNILMHTHPSRDTRPNLSSTGRHGFTIEVGPVPQGLVRHDAVIKTKRALHSFLEFLHRRNENPEELHQELVKLYADRQGTIPCFRSAPSVRKGEMSGKISWPTDEENVNFPAYMVHRDRQDRDFEPIVTGDPLFVDFGGRTIQYNGSHGSPVYLMFINEAGYYFSASGTGISVAIKTSYDLDTGMLVEDKEEQDEL